MNKQDFVVPSDRWTTEVILAEVTSRSFTLVSQQSDLNPIPDQLPTNNHLPHYSQSNQANPRAAQEGKLGNTGPLREETRQEGHG